MNWHHFIPFAVAAFLCWCFGAVAAWRNGRTRTVVTATLAGSVIFACFIAGMWISSGQPPLRTMGETRLWYSLFMPLVGLFIFTRWRYRWMPTFGLVLATVFIAVNIFKPQIHYSALPPVLRSPWFVPHVVAYIFAYALIGAATVTAIWDIWIRRLPAERRHTEMYYESVGAGFAFLTIGIILGSLWAKAAWGEFWSWDPKETWAAATWFMALATLHLRFTGSKRTKHIAAFLLATFLLIQICWYGINYLPSARRNSMHVYGQVIDRR